LTLHKPVGESMLFKNLLKPERVVNLVTYGDINEIILKNQGLPLPFI